MPQTTAFATRPDSAIGHIVLHFTPNWFATCMGTGILAVALGQFPALPVAAMAGTGLYLANIALFTLFIVVYGLKWLVHTRIAMRLLEHPVQSMFLGTIPMALATIVNG